MSKKKLFLLMMLLCTVSFIAGQNKLLKGNITDEQKDPLIGVSIGISGTSRGTLSDIDGNYSLEVAPNDLLEYSYVGMTSQTIKYQGQPTINVVMKNDDELLDEVVVIGYQTIKKADLTGAVAVFNPNQMKNTIVTGTVGDALGGMSGLNVRSSGNPGNEGKVVIRGMGTFGNSDPLYVVDGVISGANRDFNYNDIESIQVLKDASAAAIYGSRAGNGVIIITTKQGKKGDMKIEVSSRLSLQWLPKYDLTDRDQWIRLNDLAFSNGGKDLADHFDANTDWQKVVRKTGVVNDHNISFSGGADKNRYFISGNFQDNSGTTIGTKSKRFTLRSNTSSWRDFGEHVTFRVGENITLSHFSVDELNTNPLTDSYRMLPTIPVYDPNNAAIGGFGLGDGTRDVTFGTNPVAKEYLQDTKNSNLRIRGNAYTELEVLKMLKYKFNFGFDFSNDKYEYLQKVGTWRYQEPYAPSLLNKNQAQSHNLLFDNTLEFNKTIEKHSISAVVGTSFQDTNYEKIWGSKNDVMTNGDEYFLQLDAALSNPKTGSFQNKEKLFSIFGRLNYNFDERYLFSFTMRRDESSKFSKDDRVGYFPSISGGWRISNEKFFNVDWINDLKIRANYGTLGTSNNGYYDYISLINLYPQVVFGNNILHTGMTQTALVNDKLKWEKMTQVNAGFDATLLNNRLLVTFDFFSKESKDVLTRMPILLSAGHSGAAPWLNAATLRNRGVELSLTWRDQIGKDWDYSVGVNATYLKNKIVSLPGVPEGFDQWDTKSIPGQSIGQWYLIKTDGIFRSEAEVQAHVDKNGKLIQPNAQPGDIKYVDANGDGQITDKDRVYCGETMPKYELGINLGLRYRDFDLQVQMTGAFGHKIFNGPRSTFDKFDDNSNYRADYDPWTVNNPNAKDPRPIYGDSRNVRGDQDRWLENGNYLKFKQIAIGYNLPKSILKNYLQSARIYVNAQNLFTITSYSGLDPEFLNTNIWDRSYDGGAIPNPIGITFGAQISF